MVSQQLTQYYPIVSYNMFQPGYAVCFAYFDAPVGQGKQAQETTLASQEVPVFNPKESSGCSALLASSAKPVEPVCPVPVRSSSKVPLDLFRMIISCLHNTSIMKALILTPRGIEISGRKRSLRPKKMRIGMLFPTQYIKSFRSLLSEKSPVASSMRPLMPSKGRQRPVCLDSIFIKPG